MEDPEEEIIVAVMGVTGAGKSYFIREVSRISDVEVSSGLHSCTTEVQSYLFPYAGIKIRLVDTPGFNDTNKPDTQVLTEICAWMSSNYRKGKVLSGVIYLHNITEVRMTGSSTKYVRMFRRLCGPDAMPNVLLTTTQWANVNQKLGEQHEGELQSGDFWGGLIREGASVERFMGTRESGLELIDKLIGNQPEPLKIQKELVDEGKSFNQTSLGGLISEILNSLLKKFRKVLGGILSAIQEAITGGDDLLREILEEEEVQSRQELEKAVSETDYLASMSV